MTSSAISITDAAGAALDIDQGTGNVTYNGSIGNTAGRSVEITNHGGPGGGSTILVAGPITDTGTGNRCEPGVKTVAVYFSRGRMPG